MTLGERERNFTGRFAIIDDAHERLAAVAAFKPALLPLAEAERREAHRVRGCVSRVWLAGSLENGRCRFRFHADSPMVRGLAGLMCALYDDAPPAEIVALEPSLFEELGVARNLSPTRLNGLASVRSAIREFARECVAAQASAQDNVTG